jgi:hypothetical protein
VFDRGRQLAGKVVDERDHGGIEPACERPLDDDGAEGPAPASQRHQQQGRVPPLSDERLVETQPLRGWRVGSSVRTGPARRAWPASELAMRARSCDRRWCSQTDVRRAPRRVLASGARRARASPRPAGEGTARATAIVRSPNR